MKLNLGFFKSFSLFYGSVLSGSLALIIEKTIREDEFFIFKKSYKVCGSSGGAFGFLGY
jgi:hypothetical protein